MIDLLDLQGGIMQELNLQARFQIIKVPEKKLATIIDMFQRELHQSQGREWLSSPDLDADITPHYFLLKHRSSGAYAALTGILINPEAFSPLPCELQVQSRLGVSASHFQSTRHRLAEISETLIRPDFLSEDLQQGSPLRMASYLINLALLCETHRNLAYCLLDDEQVAFYKQQGAYLKQNSSEFELGGQRLALYQLDVLDSIERLPEALQTSFHWITTQLNQAITSQFENKEAS